MVRAAVVVRVTDRFKVGQCASCFLESPRNSPSAKLGRCHALASVVGVCEVMASANGQLPDWLGRLLCFLGLHDFRLVESIGGFGVGGQVEKVECRRCGHVTTRHG